MKKQKLTATTPYGVFTRTTGHTYKFVTVVASYSPTWLAAERARVDRMYGAHAPTHVAKKGGNECTAFFNPHPR